MHAVRDYEKKVIAILTRGVLTPAELTTVLNAEPVAYDYTGVGYFLTLRHESLPKQRIVCDKPIVIGKSEGTETGFIVFLENHELTLECHAWSDNQVPEAYRDQDVAIVAT
jgi:hypothetical protein